MTKARIQILFVFAMLVFANSALAHPLGNFSVNQFARVEVGRSEIKVHQVLDMAEIPTFQESAAIDTDKDGTLSQIELAAYAANLTPAYVSKLSLSINGVPAELKVSEKNILLVAGAGNLPTLRIEWDLMAPISTVETANKVTYQNDNYPDRIGWREIVVSSTAGVTVYDSSAYASGLSDELRSYPQDLLSSPLSERSATFSMTNGKLPENAVILTNRDGRPAVSIQKDRLAELIAVPEITPLIALFGLFVAFGLGAVHAMSPGHGKTVVGAYLVGSKGTPKHAVFLGLTVTITHTLGVFALGFITLFASNYILPERIMPFLGFVSGLLVFFIGISLFKERLFTFFGRNRETGHHHSDHDNAGHDGESTHSHDGVTHTHGGSTHSHAPIENLTWRKLLALGISGGLLPCPSALVLMLSAISLGRIGYGLVLTLVFSFGLAATLTTVGLLFLYIGKAVGGTAFANNRLIKALPVFSAFVVASLGAVICYNSLG